MKKLLFLIVSVCLIITFVGCGSDAISDTTDYVETSNVASESTNSIDQNFELLTYFDSNIVNALTEISDISDFDLSTTLKAVVFSLNQNPFL